MKNKKDYKGTSKAQIFDEKSIIIKTPDGEIFKMFSNLGCYKDLKYKDYTLHLIEAIFDKNFSEDKEKMIEGIVRDFFRNTVHCMGINYGDRHNERVRIGKRIRELRENKNMEAKELAILANIDAANLCRIEQGKYSTGVDILYRIAFALDAQLDIIPKNK